MQLEMSQSYFEATAEVRAQVCNGCGPGGWKFDIIPDNLYGLDITEACNIHDWDYTVGETEADKKVADERLLCNLITICKSGSWVLRPFRIRAAKGYYESVSHFGHDAFWANKK